MFRKSALIALAAVAALGATMLTTSSADAYGGFRGSRGGMHSGSFARGPSHFRHSGMHLVRHHNYRPHWHVHLRRPVWYGPRYVSYGVAPLAAAPVVNRCTCLTKEYTPEGAVLFKDICTNEAAINPPAAAPQQTGMYQSQPQQ